MASKDENLLQYTEERETLNLNTLESHLWEAADILRGSIDAADYKNYIFGLLFLKRINDRFEEETWEIAEELTGDDEEPDEDFLEQIRGDRDLHEEFWVPERARWSHIAAQSTDIGATLNKALEAVEDENDTIADRVLTTVDFNDKDRLSDATLEELVTHFSKHRYRNADLEDPDIFGRAYEYLIRQFADDAGKKGGEFYTPREVVQLLVECVDPEPGDRVYDPACGSAGMLIYSAQHIQQKGGEVDDISLYGQEKNLNTWAIGEMNVLLHELQDASLAKGDTFTEPKFVNENGELEVFDKVLANPPWNQKKWNKEWVQNNEPHNRFPYGLPPKNAGDWAWVQLMLSSLGEDGKMAVIFDNGLLFRSGSEGNIREDMLKADLIEAVIALPEDLFYNTSLPGCVLIVNKDKPEHRKEKVQLIYAEDQYLRESGVEIFEDQPNQNRLTSQGVEKLVDTYQSSGEEPHHSRVVPLDEILENGGVLTVPRYIDTLEEEDKVELSQAAQAYENLREKQSEVDKSVQDAIQRVSHASSHEEFSEAQFVSFPADWEMRKIGDVCEISGGSTPKKSNEAYWGGDTLWASPKDFKKEKMIETEDHVTDKGIEERSLTLYDPGPSMIVSRSGILQRKLPVAKIVKPTTVNQDVKVLQPDTDLFDEEFFFRMLQYLSEPIRKTCSKSGTTVESIDTTLLKNYRVPIPPMDTQRRLASEVEDARNTCSEYRGLLEDQIENVSDVEQGIVRELMSGKSRVSDLD